MPFGTRFNDPFTENIEELTVRNRHFRRVLHTSPTMQLVVMSLLPEESIGMESHPYTTQFFRVEKGRGVAVVDGLRTSLNDGDVLVVPPGCKHNISNVSESERLQLYTIYAPPHHPIGTVQRVKPRD